MGNTALHVEIKFKKSVRDFQSLKQRFFILSQLWITTNLLDSNDGFM